MARVSVKVRPRKATSLAPCTRKIADSTGATTSADADGGAPVVLLG